MKRTALFSLLLIGALCAWHSAHALTLTFADTQRYWPGWKNGTGDDGQDTIGDPDFTGGTITVEGTFLRQITFTFQGWGSGATWGKLQPGDLFLDVDSDDQWEYVVYSGNWSLYSVDLPLDSTDDYLESGKDNAGYWAGYLIRDNHPIGLDEQPADSALLETIDFTGWGTTTLTFDFGSSIALTLPADLTLGFTVNCANDVVYETVRIHTPEPASMLLLGTGLVGLAGWAKRRKGRQPQA